MPLLPSLELVELLPSSTSFLDASLRPTHGGSTASINRRQYCEVSATRWWRSLHLCPISTGLGRTSKGQLRCQHAKDSG
ncbi:unnamed protein product [Jaminaea pallidilutea]